MNKLQALIDAAQDIAIPEYERISGERWRVECAERRGDENMKKACKALALAVRRKLPNVPYRKGGPSVRWEVSAHPLVNHAVRPMTWEPRIQIAVHVVLWDTPRRDWNLTLDIYPIEVGAVEDGIARIKAMVKDLCGGSANL